LGSTRAAAAAAARLPSAAVRAIDVRHLGRSKVICCWEVDGVLIDPGPQSGEAVLLEELGDLEPRAVVLTHIHLDHAGTAGSLVRRWPDLPVYVHERGAPHLLDPSRLVASASRIYPDMDRRWGEILPIPEENIHVMGDRVLGDYRVAYTPGHASHHVSLLHEPTGTAFVGDVMGVRVAPELFTLMPTPPPDIDVEAWHASIDLVLEWDPAALALTHFGLHEDVGDAVDAAREELDACAAASRNSDDAAFLDWYMAHLRQKIADDEIRAAHIQASPPPLEYLGLERYWRKHGDERHAG
jgi:glyoxylase-like metal-dependent hydrolase (beta-lactamase superfamily II)